MVEAAEQIDTEDKMKTSVPVEEGPVDDEHAVPEAQALVPHYRNDKIPLVWRWFVIAFLVAAFAILLAADVGSGVAANYILYRPSGEVFEERTLLTVSIFSSVHELWNTGSYPLAIFVCLTSVSWPFVKLILSLYAWIVPFSNAKRRERLIEIVDAFDKWSFVDIFVLLIIMVAFRADINLAFGVTLQVVLVPKWGFYTFVLATMMSLVGSHMVLFWHRRIVFGTPLEEDNSKEQPNATSTTNETTIARKANMPRWLVILMIIVSVVLHAIGCSVFIYEVTSEKGGEVRAKRYSVIQVGHLFPKSATDPNDVAIRWMQAMFMFLSVALPFLNAVMFGLLYLIPWKPRIREILFFATEICFAWSSIEVLLVSIIFSISQIPQFGNGLIDAGCEQCYIVGSSFLGTFTVLCVSTVYNVATNVLLYGRAHKAVYGTPHSAAQQTN